MARTRRFWASARPVRAPSSRAVRSSRRSVPIAIFPFDRDFLEGSRRHFRMPWGQMVVRGLHRIIRIEQTIEVQRSRQDLDPRKETEMSEDLNDDRRGRVANGDGAAHPAESL